MFAHESALRPHESHSPVLGRRPARGPRSPPNSSANTSTCTARSLPTMAVYLIMPTSNTACFQALLDVLARKFVPAMLVLDDAPNHRCGDLLVLANITLLYLAPYSPELNPKQNLWVKSAKKSSRTMH